MTRRANWTARALCTLAGTVLGLSLATTTLSGQITADQKAKIKGTIVARSGDLVKVNDKKTGTTVMVLLTDGTKIERKKSKYTFFVHKDMDMTAMLPGLAIEAEGVGNAKGQLVAKTISFVPDEFAIEVAEEQQIMANKSAAGKAQSTANQGVQQAQAAQASADTAQATADVAGVAAVQAGQTADAAGAAAVYDAAAIDMVNKRVTDLGDYTTVAEAGIYFPSDKADLDDAAKADLDTLAAAIKGTPGYLIEIAGYASSTGSKQLNQKLSADRAAAVTHYLMEKDNVPMRRILAPAGYGASHPAATNTDAQGRALNRRVDVKVIVNKGLNEES
ncbi:MAG: OmpA family protein [Acidobacteriaceae bacterium]|nr:OmpA family protein [Acidobacteriaceae bacterium]